jgi:hypothetical protein
VLIVLGALVAFGASLAFWVDRQLLDTNAWAQSSSRLLDDPSIRSVISHEIVARLRREALPLSSRDPQVASALQGISERDVDGFLNGAPAHALWRQMNQQAHAQLVSELDSSRPQSEVVLDLEPLLVTAARSLGLGALSSSGQIQGGRIILARPGELNTASRLVTALRSLGAWMGAAAVLLFALALALGRGRRALVLASCGLSLLFVGGGLALVRLTAADAVVDAYVQNTSYRPAIHSAWLIETRPLAGIALALAVIGVVLLVAGLLARLIGRIQKARPTAAQPPG